MAMIFITRILFGFFFLVLSKSESGDFLNKIPEGLSIGSAGAAYQIEGAWNVSDKGISVWDWYTHNNISRIFDQSNGDIACDSYRKYKEDVKLVKELGFGGKFEYLNSWKEFLMDKTKTVGQTPLVDELVLSFYALNKCAKAQLHPISPSKVIVRLYVWTRILPTGFPNVVSKDGIKYYHDLLDEIERNGLVPFVTLYHWDHPQTLNDLGGWTSELMIDWFADFARVVFREIGPRVKVFTTFNEPTVICDWGYADVEAPPGLNMKGTADYICVHNALKAHARAYHVYDEEFRPQQNGTIGIVIPCRHHFAKYLNDSIAAEVAFQFDCGWSGHPIFSEHGDYPKVMKERIAENSKLEGWPRSRLPSFSRTWIDYIKGTSDYFGLNHYTSDLVESVPKINGTLWYKDSGIMKSRDPKWPDTNSTWLKVVPEGFGALLRKIKEEYDNVPVYVMENGLSDSNLIDDYPRLKYFYTYMKEMLIAINRDGCNVKAYTVWSLLDNFQWARGYSERFGIVHVDFNDRERKRTLKKSALWLKDVLRAGRLLPYRNYTSLS